MLFQNKCLPLSALLLYALIFTFGCKDNGYSAPQNYNIDKPVINLLGKDLKEISGIFMAPDSMLLAISDNKEKVIGIDLKTRQLKDITGKIVEKGSDLEDIVQVDSSIYLLMSKGILLEVRADLEDTSEVNTYELGLSGRNDFESLYHDRTINSLIMLCKTCSHEKGEGIRTAYKFDLQTKTFDSTAFYTINKDSIKTILKNTDAQFDPSAAAIHPINKKLYILSSAGNLLVITDNRGKVMGAYNLNPDDFPQAEGIAFAPNGDMYISNEGKYGQPTLLRFPYLENRKKK